MTYEVIQELTNFRDVAAILKDDEHWLFVGTGGYHGSEWSLADCERILKGEDEKWSPGGAYITVFIFDPRHVTLRWGDIHLKSLNEVEWLREKVKNTIDKVIVSQAHNT